MLGNKFIHYAPLLPIVYIGFYFGLLPYKWDVKHLSMPGFHSDQDLLYHSRVGLFISYIYALIGLFVGYTNVRLTFDLATKYSSCFDDICWGPVCRNVCVHLVIVWVVYIGCISAMLSVLFYRKQLTLQCLNDMNRIIGPMNIKIPLLTSFLILLFLTFQVVSFIYQMNRSKMLFHFVLEFSPPYLLICLTLANACVTALMLKILELGYMGLNSQVDGLFNNYNRRIITNILDIMQTHWNLTNLTDLCSKCVRVDLMIIGVSSTVRVIYFMFSMLRFLEESMKNPDSKFSAFQSVIFLVTVVGPFVSLCYRCNRVVQELSDFLEQAKVRQISFTACGLFTLNLRLVCTIFGITMTYFIVLKKKKKKQLMCKKKKKEEEEKENGEEDKEEEEKKRMEIKIIE
ncbi:hypothetical protein M8J75_006489 [Diaphorina citri]|nr:hypothetical protein M8J75_006489 [Diaphorina citri]